MAEFNLAALFGAVSELDTGAETGRKKIEYISLDRLHPDPNNFYELSGIEELAANIELLGLQQPICVRLVEDGYMIVSGHRRCAALRRLVEDGREDLRQVPCLVEKEAGSPELQELRLIYANADTRTMTSAELARQAERVEALLYALKEQGMEFPGRMRDHVAEACRMSKSKLARLKVIRENLKPENLRKAWEEGRLNESCAYEIARRPAMAQDMAGEVLNHVLRLGAEEIAGLMDRLERQAETQARAKKAVETSLQRLAPSIGAESYEQYVERMRKEDMDFFTILAGFAESFVRRVPEMGTNRKDNIDAVRKALRGSGGGSFEANYRAEGSKLGLDSPARKIGRIERNWTEAYDMLAAIAINAMRERSACPSGGKEEADCRGPVGLAMTGLPAPAWQEGLPKKRGRYVVRFDLGQGKTFDELVEYDAWDRSFFFPASGDLIEYPCIGWWPVPTEEDEDE